MTSTSGCIVHGLRNGQISDGDLSKSFVEQCMYTYQSPTPELVIRTSGEHRISDFLSWQVLQCACLVSKAILYIGQFCPSIKSVSLVFHLFIFNFTNYNYELSVLEFAKLYTLRERAVARVLGVESHVRRFQLPALCRAANETISESLPWRYRKCS